MDLLRLTDPASVRQGQWSGPLPPVLAGRDEVLDAHFREAGAWGMEAAIDLADCDPVAIRDASTIAAFNQALCDHIQMRRYGAPLLVRFGSQERVAGYSLVQLIETSTISAHFIEISNAVCLNLFSCKGYAPYQAAAFCQDWFSAQAVRLTVMFRGPQAAPTEG